MRKRPLCAICVLFIAVQAIRVCFFSVEGMKPSALEMQIKNGSAISGTGIVYRIEEKEKVTAVFLKDNAVSLSGLTVEESRLLVYVKQNQWKENLKIGNRIALAGEAQIFDTARNPGNFDQKMYYQRQGIHVLVWADKTEVVSADYDLVRQFMHELRGRWESMLVRHLGNYYGGTMSAVLLGEKAGLDPEMKKMYQKNGISHLLAISGLHMSFIGMGVYDLLRKTGAGFGAAGTAGGVTLILYSLMIGAGASSQRALIMFLVRVGAEITGRDYDLPTSLALSAALLCAGEPLYLTDAGFQLSYGAILGIAAAGPVFYEAFGCGKLRTSLAKEKQKMEAVGVRRGQRAGRIMRSGALGALHWMMAGLSTSLAVNLVLLGPLLYFYFEVPPYSVFLNLLVIPIMPAAMGAGLIGSAVCLVWEPAGGMILNVCRPVLFLYDCVCAAAGKLPGSRFVTGRPGTGWLIVYYAVLLAGIILFYYLRECQEKEEEKWCAGEKIGGGGGERARRKMAAYSAGRCAAGWFLLGFAVCMAVICRGACRGRDVSVTVLDVGQGDGIHIHGEEGEYLIDGGSSDVTMAGTYRIEPYLLANAADALDYVFVTHGDEDHISGIRELLEGQELGIRIRNLVLPPEEYHDESIRALARTAEENNTRILEMEPGDSIRDRKTGEGMMLRCLAPNAETQGEENGREETERDDTKVGTGAEPEAGNSASLVLEMEYGAFDMLFTGDLEGEGEASLIESGRLKQYDVLKAAHHGSREANSEELLDLVRPKAAVISAGVDNRYGHPHQETLERIAQANSRIYSTRESGAVRIETDGEKMKIRGWLDGAG